MKLNKDIINKIVLFACIVYAVTLLERFLTTYKEQTKNTAYEVKKGQFEIKINNYEKAIFEDSVVIYNSDRAYRDSLRATINPR